MDHIKAQLLLILEVLLQKIHREFKFHGHCLSITDMCGTYRFFSHFLYQQFFCNHKTIMTNSTSCAVHSNLNSKIWRHYGDNSQKQVRNLVARIFPLSFSLSSSAPLFFSSLDSCHIFVKVAARIRRARGGKGEMWAQDWKLEERRVLKVQPRNQPRGGARPHRPLQGLRLWLGAGSLWWFQGIPWLALLTELWPRGPPFLKPQRAFTPIQGRQPPAPAGLGGARLFEVQARSQPATVQPSQVGRRSAIFPRGWGGGLQEGPQPSGHHAKAAIIGRQRLPRGLQLRAAWAASRNSHSPGSTGGRPVRPTTTLCPL